MHELVSLTEQQLTRRIAYETPSSGRGTMSILSAQESRVKRLLPAVRHKEHVLLVMLHLHERLIQGHIS